MQFLGKILLPVAIIVSTSSSVFAGDLMCGQVPDLFQYYFEYHYSNREMTDDIRNKTVDQYIKFLDPSKSLFIESDVSGLKASLKGIFKSMETGNCSALNDAQVLTVKRAEEDEAYVKSVLNNKDYKVDDSVELVSDPEKRGFPKNLDEKKALVLKLIHFQMSQYLLTESKLAEAKKKLIHKYELLTKRLKEPKALTELPGNLTLAFASALDPHSSYLSSDAFDDFQIQMGLSLEGIGASLSSQDGFTVIEELIPGGGAEKTKLLKAKDKIIAVAQEGKKAENVVDMDLKDVVKKIRGKKGTKVTLTILRQAEKTETFDVKITRDKVDVKDQAAKVTYETKKVGNQSYKIAVIDLPSFYGSNKEGSANCYVDMKRIVKEVKDAKAHGIVLNLSKNGGGLLEDAVRISGLFIQKGGIVATKDTKKKVQILPDEDPEVQWNGPLVVLISRMSASASEILAGAMKDYRRAVILGSDHTFGKGTVQILSPLPLGLGAMKVTTGMFFIPGGASTQHVGVASDIQIPTPWAGDDIGEKTLDYSLPTQTIPAFLGKEANSTDPAKQWKEVSSDLTKKLAEKSKSRVASDKRFAEMIKEQEEVKKNKGVIKLADLRKKAKKPAENKAEREKKQKDIEAPFVDEGVAVMVDLLQEQPPTALTARK
ncbi:MAG: PDZ domain-containing protein [Bdellovibrionales bacterium]|nr:PDZ domain-containing protein [Bdellovibrionales bacterium]